MKPMLNPKEKEKLLEIEAMAQRLKDAASDFIKQAAPTEELQLPKRLNKKQLFKQTLDARRTKMLDKRMKLHIKNTQ